MNNSASKHQWLSPHFRQKKFQTQTHKQVIGTRTNTLAVSSPINIPNTNNSNSSNQSSEIPTKVDSGKFEKLLSLYRPIIESLKSIYPLTDLFKWSKKIVNKKPNLEFVEKLKQIKTILTNEQSKMENSLTSVECITKNMEETTEILINTKNEILKNQLPSKIIVEQVKEIIPKTNKITAIIELQEKSSLLKLAEMQKQNQTKTSQKDQTNQSNEDNLPRLSIMTKITAKSFSELSKKLTNSELTEISEVTIRELIDLIVVPNKIEGRKIHTVKLTFLSTLTYFTNPNEVLDILVLRYCFVPSIKDSSNRKFSGLEPFECVREEIQIPIRFQIIRLIRSWVNMYFNRDFYECLSARNRLKQFLELIIASTGNLTLARNILDTLSSKEQFYSNYYTNKKLKKLNRTDMLNRLKNLSKSTNHDDYDSQLTTIPLQSIKSNENDHISPPLLLLMNTDPLILALQLTWFEFNGFYSKITENELLHQAWNKSQTKYKAKHITRAIRHFNRFSGWIVRSLLAQDNLEDRALLLKRVIVFGLHLLKLNNFNGLLEILCALSNCAIERMTCTWNLLGYEFFTIFTTLQTLIGKLNVFRNLWQNCFTSGIPYIGKWVFIKNITH